MAAHAHDVPRIAPTLERPPEERPPVRGRFSSVLLAIGAIALILAVGIFAVVYYAGTSEYDPETGMQDQMQGPWK